MKVHINSKTGLKEITYPGKIVNIGKLLQKKRLCNKIPPL